MNANQPIGPMTKPKNDAPPKLSWAGELADRYAKNESCVFVLSLNVDDHANSENLPTDDLLKLVFAKKIAVTYNISDGIRFPEEAMRKLALEVLGLAPGEAEQRMSANMSRLTSLGRGGAPASGFGGGDVEVKIPGEGPGASVSDALDTIHKLLRAKKPDSIELVGTLAIFDYAGITMPDAPGGYLPENEKRCLVKLLEIAKDVEIEGSILILKTRNYSDLHNELRSHHRVGHVEIPLPDEEDRLGYIRMLGGGNIYSEPLKLEKGYSPEMFARQSSGLTRFHLEDIYLRSSAEKVPVSPQLVMKRKEDIIKKEYADLIEMPPLNRGYESFGGNDLAKQYFLKHIIRPMKEGDLRRCKMGVALVGAPGCGKTLFVKATAKEAGVNFIMLNPAKLKGGIVGQSEKQLELALTCVYANRPCVVFIDEIDIAIPQGRNTGGDSGVSAGQLRSIMEVTSNRELLGQVLWLYATNRPDACDPAFFRPGRVDRIVPFLAPETREDRVQVAQAVCGFMNYATALSDIEWLSIGELTDGFTHAEIEALLGKADELAYEDDAANEVILFEHIQEAAKRLVPNTRDVREMTEIAVMMANDLDLVPDRWREWRLQQTAGNTVQNSVNQTESEPPRRTRGRGLNS